MISMIVVAAAITVLLVAFMWAAYRLTRMPASQEYSSEWVEKFSIERYRPMERLLQNTDYDFLASQPGYDPAIIRKLRSERRRIFAGYLRALSRDFDRLYTCARTIVLYSAADRPDLARLIVQQRFAFLRGMMIVRLRLVLHDLGLASVNASDLLKLVDSFSQSIRPAELSGQSSMA